ncbi:MAG: glycine dehydrogenase, partial [Sphingomonadaceae bacterium]|nr:glycine dehydrogenase [Sphingomonadaceae bacterium]
MRYLPLTDTDRQAMLATIGAKTIDDLFVDVPEEARLNGPIEGLPMHASEMAVERHFSAMARKNMAAAHHPFFLGAGAYKHHVPASVDHLIQRGEFLTAYTPYQPEIAQGTLQMLFEFQTQVARLFGCDIANASMYDGATSCAEAALMAMRLTGRSKIVLGTKLNPQYKEVLESYLWNYDGAELSEGQPDDQTACVIVQSPDFFGKPH